MIAVRQCWSAVLGECGTTFTSGANNTENWKALQSHYMEKLGRGDHGHLQFIRRHADELSSACFCGVCDHMFSRPVDLFRHLGSKVNSKKNGWESVAHVGFFEAVVLPFVGMRICMFVIFTHYFCNSVVVVEIAVSVSWAELIDLLLGL